MTSRFGLALVLTVIAAGCGDDSDGDGGAENTTQVGAFDGLFDDIVTGFNFPFDIGVVPALPEMAGTLVPGHILVANYGTSEVLLADPAAGGGATTFYDGTDDDLRGTTGISIPPQGTVWVSFEQGGDGNSGGIAVLSSDGDRIAVFDSATFDGAFANPGGICYGGSPAAEVHHFFFVNLGDGTAWRITATSASGDDAEITQVGEGLAEGNPGNPGTAPNGVKSQDLPEGGARGCVHHNGSLYVADAQNARVVRFDDADTAAAVLEGHALEDVPSGVLTYPTDITVNSDGALIVISNDNAHAFVALDTPTGAFVDNGLYDLNVNSGNYGTQVTDDTIWFTRANNTNGALRAITPNQDHPPSTDGPFPAQ